MLSIGWTEMLIVAAIALIVVGPKDLPAMLRHIGKFVGSARRMGNDFKAELNKVAAIDDIRNIKKSFTEPLNETRTQIESEFNSIMPDGKVVPSGVIKPADPNAESVVDEIRNAAGMGPSLTDNAQAAKDAIASAVTKAAQASEDAAAKTTAAKTATGKAVSAKSATKPATKTGAKTGAKAKARAKPAAAKSAVAKPQEKPAPKPRARRVKPKTAKPKTAKAKPAVVKTAQAKTAQVKPVQAKTAKAKPAKLHSIADTPDDK